MDTLLYHYNPQQFSVLKSRIAQGLPKTEFGPTRGHPYDGNVSFFFDPLPLDMLPGLYKGSHPFYIAGQQVYEHTVDMKDLDGSFWNVVEHPEKVDLYYDHSVSDADYRIKLDQVEKKLGYYGTEWRKLAITSNRFKGRTREYFEKLPSRPNFESIKNKYAPTVPHLMTWPKTGQIKVMTTLLRTMG